MGAVTIVAAVANDEGFRIGLVATAYGFGLRHGIDWDHIAAISDITSSQETPRRSLLSASFYAIGHGFVVFVLGVLAIVFAERLPSSVDAGLERVVGVTLLVLGAYVFYALAKHGRNFRLRSRWMLLFAAVRRLARQLRRTPTSTVIVIHDHQHPLNGPHSADALADRGTAAVGPTRGVTAGHRHSHPHRHVAPMPDDPFLAHGKATSFGVGMIHGVGAETPTQVLLFLAAAGAGGKGAGVLLLVCFLAGLITSNTALALASTFGFLGAATNFRVYAAVSVVIAAFSLALGLLFLLGRGDVMPAILTS